jgi:hypothetical protein
VALVWVIWVDPFVALTLASTTTAPELSVTTPVMVPFTVFCAWVAILNRRLVAANNKTLSPDAFMAILPYIPSRSVSGLFSEVSHI